MRYSQIGLPYHDQVRSVQNSTSTSEVPVQGKLRRLLGPIAAGHHACLLVLTHALLEKVGLALQGNHLHPIKRIRGVPDLAVPQCTQQAIRHKLNILCHQILVHADEVTWQRATDEVPLHFNGSTDDVLNNVFGQFVLQHGIEQARKIRMQTFVAGDEFVGESKPRHQAPFLQPEECTEGAAEEDALHRCEGHQTLGEASLFVHPLHGPPGFVAHGWHGVDGIKELVLLHRVFDVLFD
mmetsp:Transcript_15251/g.33601  ORF Transcript_15251/g.33601 Transcript_15251/m.33601 type:complete len:238 (-) Transcript_15251:447-1160(-)